MQVPWHAPGRGRSAGLVAALATASTVAGCATPAAVTSGPSAALVFRGTELAEVVAAGPGARAYRVERGPGGGAIETELPTRYLG